MNRIIDVGDKAYTISYQVKLKEQCYFLESKCVEEFQLQMLATYKGVRKNNEKTTNSSNSIINYGIGNEKPLVIKINKLSEAN